MVLNKQKGNMYGFVTHTWNPIKGKCSHDCKYCYMKVWKQKPLRLVEKELEDDLGSGNFIFVGSSTDMFADNVSRDWIARVLNHCMKYPDNTYLFQTKNPRMFHNCVFPKKTIFGTTLETNYINNFLSKAPSVDLRASAMKRKGGNKMVTIEPIVDFNLEFFVRMIKEIQPKWVNIGADSKNHKLPEPTKEKVFALIDELKKFTDVKIKDNLKRLTGGK